MSTRDGRVRSQSTDTYVVDGIKRSAQDEHKINQVLMQAFKGPAGRAALDYLKEMTLYSVHPPGTEGHVLQHAEGARYLVALIRKRINDGEKGLPHVSS